MTGAAFPVQHVRSKCRPGDACRWRLEVETHAADRQKHAERRLAWGRAPMRIGLNLPAAWPVRIPDTFMETIRSKESAFAASDSVAARQVRPREQSPAMHEEDAASRRWYELYLIGAIEERAVLRNIFLDGNTFNQGYHVIKNTSVFDYDVGVVARVFWLTMSYRLITRSPDFTPGDIPHRFGSISLGIGHPY
jgi:Uncharacterized protein conserved in bacteria (DUF2219)